MGVTIMFHELKKDQRNLIDKYVQVLVNEKQDRALFVSTVDFYHIKANCIYIMTRIGYQNRTKL